MVMRKLGLAAFLMVSIAGIAEAKHMNRHSHHATQAAEHSDLVLGSRYVPGGGVTDWGLLRRALSRGGSLYAFLGRSAFVVSY